MAGDWSRRQVLRRLGASALAGVAGCTDADSDGGRLSVTPAPVPSDTPSPAPRPTRRPNPTGESLRFDVAVLDGFDVSHTARLSISIRNVGELALSAVGHSPYVFPFVDDEYAGTDRGGRPKLFLLPKDAPLVTRAPGEDDEPVATLLPDGEEGGCWSVSFEGRPPVFPSTRYLYSVTLSPGESVRHDYHVYFIGPCEPGRYSFQAATLVGAGQPPGRNGMFRLLTGFYLSISSGMDLSIGLEDPVIDAVASPADR